MTDEITVVKLNHKRREVWCYEGHIITRKPGLILLEAVFNRPDLKLHYVTLRTGDIFQELYYTNRWYNIYQVQDKRDRHVKYWYCNVARPAHFTVNQIRYIDLALDLLVFPDGRCLELDWDEFNNLDLTRITRQKAIEGLNQLNQIAKKGDLPRLFQMVE